MIKIKVILTRRHITIVKSSILIVKKWAIIPIII